VQLKWQRLKGLIFIGSKVYSLELALFWFARSADKEMGMILQDKTAWKLSYRNSKAAYCTTCSLITCTNGKKLEQFALKLPMELFKKSSEAIGTLYR